MAWMKLRRRNIAPLLNANGWAINASSKISIPFGATLTDIAQYPKLRLKDPYAKTGMPLWAKLLVTTVIGLVIGGLAWWYFTKDSAAEMVEEETATTEQVEVVAEEQPAEATAETTSEG